MRAARARRSAARSRTQCTGAPAAAPPAIGGRAASARTSASAFAQPGRPAQAVTPATASPASTTSPAAAQRRDRRRRVGGSRAATTVRHGVTTHARRRRRRARAAAPAVSSPSSGATATARRRRRRAAPAGDAPPPEPSVRVAEVACRIRPRSHRCCDGGARRGPPTSAAAIRPGRRPARRPPGRPARAPPAAPGTPRAASSSTATASAGGHAQPRVRPARPAASPARAASTGPASLRAATSPRPSSSANRNRPGQRGQRRAAHSAAVQRRGEPADVGEPAAIPDSGEARMLRTRSCVADGSSPAAASRAAESPRSSRRSPRSWRLPARSGARARRRARRRRSATHAQRAASSTPPGSRTRASAPSAASCGAKRARAGVGARTARAPGHCRPDAGVRASASGSRHGLRRRRRDADRVPCDSDDATRRAVAGSRCESGAVPPLSPRRDPPGARTLPRAVGRDPGRGSRGRSAMPGADPEGGLPVILLLSTSDTDLLSRPRQRRRLPARPTRPGSPSTTCRPCSTASTWSSCGSSAAAGPGRTGSTRCCAGRRAGGRARRRAGAGRRADGAVDGARRASPPRRTPTSRRAGRTTSRQLHPSSPTRCCSPAGLRAARVELPTWGVLERDRAATRPARPSRSSTTGPTTLAGNTAFVEALCAARRGRGRRARCRSSARRCAAPSPTLLRRRCARADALVVTVLAAGGTKPGRRVGAAATTRPGTSARWPRWTCRSCRACA